MVNLKFTFIYLSFLLVQFYTKIKTKVTEYLILLVNLTQTIERETSGVF